MLGHVSVTFVDNCECFATYHESPCHVAKHDLERMARESFSLQNSGERGTKLHKALPLDRDFTVVELQTDKLC